MKHYHSKTELRQSIDETYKQNTKTDVHFIIVKTDDIYKINFKDINYKNTDLINLQQGLKIWPNRCKIRINNSIINTERLIIWNSNKDQIKINNNHTYISTTSPISIEICETNEENPNIGFFNVWSNDIQKCYEFCENSWIKIKLKKNIWDVSGHHEWELEDKETVRIIIEKIN